ncbi:MAG: phenol hydroxylase, partial [Myxococcales bacterium]|nr:phenol hydroxylase [Myxococcales bacterium]
MSIEIKTATTEPLRTTFDHLRDRLGEGKVPTRYQEAVFDLQTTLNFHYRPTWDPASKLYDPDLTAIALEDWDQLLDPRQYYYATYVMARGRQQDSQDKNFSMVEKKNLLSALAPASRERLRSLAVPLRHAEWGANQLNAYIAGYGSGAAMTSAATYQMFDRLGNAQYLSRLGLLLGNGDPAGLDVAKSDWLEADLWQPLRRLVEDLLVERDWFEIHLVQNFLLDGMLQPLIFEFFSDVLAAEGGAAFAMLTEFTVEWFGEAKRWTD